MIEFALSLCFICLLILAVDIVETYFNYKKWIKEGELLKDFPNWEKTKKPNIWFSIWCLALFLNIPLTIGVAFWIGDFKDFLILFVFIAIYFLVYEIIYHIVKAIIKNKNKDR